MSDEDTVFLAELRKEINPTSPTWKAVLKYVARRRRYSEGQLAKTGLPMIDTENHRGRRVILVELFNLTKKPTPGEDAEAGFDGIGGEL